MSSEPSWPEFLRQGQALDDFLCADHVVIGADSEEVALLAVLALHILPRRCHMIIQHLLLTILTEHALAFKSLPCYSNKVGFTPVSAK